MKRPVLEKRSELLLRVSEVVAAGVFTVGLMLCLTQQVAWLAVAPMLFVCGQLVTPFKRVTVLVGYSLISSALFAPVWLQIIAFSLGGGLILGRVH